MPDAAIFFDKDGTLIEDRPYNVDPSLITPCHGFFEAVRLLSRAGYRLFVVTNQSGVAHGFFREESLGPVAARLSSLFECGGAKLEGFYYCPHHPQGTEPSYRVDCACRKPRGGLVLQAAREHDLDLSRSWLIGDILDDVEAGTRAGCRSILVDNGNETEWRWSPARVPYAFAGGLLEAAGFILEEDHDAIA